MLPMIQVRSQLGNLLSADSSTLAPAANANKVALINHPFTPSENLHVSDLSFATFTGSTPIAGVIGAQDVGIDPSTNEQVLIVKPPAGGYIFTCTAAPAAPEIIYGFCLTDNTGATLLAVDILPTPITITQSGDYIDLGNPNMRFVLQPLS